MRDEVRTPYKISCSYRHVPGDTPWEGRFWGSVSNRSSFPQWLVYSQNPDFNGPSRQFQASKPCENTFLKGNTWTEETISGKQALGLGISLCFHFPVWLPLRHFPCRKPLLQDPEGWDSFTYGRITGRPSYTVVLIGVEMGWGWK